jgi:hypothetical protein
MHRDEPSNATARILHDIVVLEQRLSADQIKVLIYCDGDGRALSLLDFLQVYKESVEC